MLAMVPPCRILSRFCGQCQRRGLCAVGMRCRGETHRVVLGDVQLKVDLALDGIGHPKLGGCEFRTRSRSLSATASGSVTHVRPEETAGRERGLVREVGSWAAAVREQFRRERHYRGSRPDSAMNDFRTCDAG